MKIVVSPDSFKGSLTAMEAAREIAAGIREVDAAIQTVLLPVADGGEGTLEPLIMATNGHTVQVHVHDPIGRPISVEYGVLGDGETCVIEMAKASGLTLLKDDEKNPLIASTFGTGELILHALDQGYKKFVVGIGGSATNDGGTGMLRALGMKFLDKTGDEIAEGAEALAKLHKVDDTNFDKRIREAHFIIACDVDNPFIGSKGATAIFGPQKGVTADLVEVLDQNLFHLANKIEDVTGIALHEKPGAGAAGGLGGAFLAFFPVTLKPGIEVVMEAIDFKAQVEDADFIITGEGKSDVQTLSGKAPIGIANVGKEMGVPVILLSGFIEEESKLQLSPYFYKLASVVGDTVSKEQSLEQAGYYLCIRTKEVMQSIL
ncbi:glycerate kinase [Psychrobacillus sp. NEAU-3TGS]|uniref:glycerate kinase n=1 Tax=Psychrobacillus sp. NEAU-3TGS TaxID=2995412 RepID=UPI0024983E0C|nr:glycerate kinase [Psychrobacillus sp. NEAU-3TGS]MDI2587485.1 glycerate kinase [Psychrobacillus sp. NEAU-3TGS]